MSNQHWPNAILEIEWLALRWHILACLGTGVGPTSNQPLAINSVRWVNWHRTNATCQRRANILIAIWLYAVSVIFQLCNSGLHSSAINVRKGWIDCVCCFTSRSIILREPDLETTPSYIYTGQERENKFPLLKLWQGVMS